LPSLNLQILVAACLGVAIGWLTGTLPTDAPVREGVLYASTLAGSIFIGLLKMVLIPLIFTSIVVGVANLQAHHQVHRVWGGALVYFTLTTSAAMLVALVAANIFKPGAGLSLDLFAEAMNDFETRQLTLPEFFLHFFANLFQNPFAALANGSILAVVVFAMFIGIALVAGGDRYRNILVVLQEFLELMMRIISWIMRLAPLGILALLIKLVAEQDVALLSAVGGFIVLVFATTLFHGIVVLPGNIADLPALRGGQPQGAPGHRRLRAAAGRDHEHGRHSALRSGSSAVRRQSDGYRAEPGAAGGGVLHGDDRLDRRAGNSQRRHGDHGDGVAGGRPTGRGSGDPAADRPPAGHGAHGGQRRGRHHRQCGGAAFRRSRLAQHQVDDSLRVLAISSGSMPQHSSRYQSSPNISAGCWVRPAPLPQAIEVAGQ